MTGQLEIINVDDHRTDDWVEFDIAVDGVRCVPFEITRRQYKLLYSDDEAMKDFLYKSGKASIDKCGTFKNPLHQKQVEEAA